MTSPRSRDSGSRKDQCYAMATRIPPPALLYSEDERDLGAALADLLASQAAPADVLARTEQRETYDPKLWRAVAAEIGVAGLLIPEPLGGAGASYRELAAAAEQFGAAVAPIPYLGSAAVATAALLSAARSVAAAGAEADTARAMPTAPWASGEGLSGPAAAARAAALRAQAAADSVPGPRAPRRSRPPPGCCASWPTAR